MKLAKVESGILVGTVLVLVSSLALAANAGGTGRQRGAAARNSPAMQECRKEAQAKNLGKAERRTFMQQCMKDAGATGKGGKSGKGGNSTPAT